MLHFKLRDYQEKCVRAVKKSMAPRMLVQAPTGSGKTVIATRIIKELGMKTLFLVHKNILIEQTYNTFIKENESVGIYNASLNRKELDKRVIIATVQSLVNCKEEINFDLVIFDECHRAGDKEQSNHIKVYRKANPKHLIGLTATPFRTETGYIFGKDKFWPLLTFKITLQELIKSGQLMPPKYQETKEQISIEGIPLIGNDYNIGALEKRILDSEEKISLQINDVLSRAKDRKKLVWLTTSIAHAEKVKELLGEKSSIIHSKRKDNDFQKFNFERTDCRHLISVLIASEGYDFPKIDCIVMMRPTLSPVLYVQALGRGLRIHKNKEDCLFLDYGHVIENLGKVTSIDIHNKKEKYSFCPDCNEITKKNPCPHCGYVKKILCNFCMKQKIVGQDCPHCDRNDKGKLKLDNLSLVAQSGGIRTFNVYARKINYSRKFTNVLYLTDQHRWINVNVFKRDMLRDQKPRKVQLKKNGKYLNLVREIE